VELRGRRTLPLIEALHSHAGWADLGSSSRKPFPRHIAESDSVGIQPCRSPQLVLAVTIAEKGSAYARSRTPFQGHCREPH